MKLYNLSQLVKESHSLSPHILKYYSVKIMCEDESADESNNGTGTLFFDGQDYYVITAAHCIQFGKSDRHFETENIQLCVPHNKDISFEVLKIVQFDLNDEIDFALMKVDLYASADSIADYGRNISLVGSDEIGKDTCIYGYTNAYPEGRLFKIHEVSTNSYSVDDGITASGQDFVKVMKGSSGGGIFVGIEDSVYCVGYVKSRFTEDDKLDDIKVRQILDINKHLKSPYWRKSLLSANIPDAPISTGNTYSNSHIEIEYNHLWNELDKVLSEAKDADDILSKISKIRDEIKYVKSVLRQETVIHSLLRKKEKWTECEQRAFIYAVQDCGLLPNMFGEITQYNEDVAEIPELRGLKLRASTYACGTEDGELKLDETSDNDIYEMILRDAFSFDFERMYERVCNWKPSGAWVAKKALLINSFEKDEECLNALAGYIENKENFASERFVASLIYNVSCQVFPLPMKYEEFWRNGIDSPSEIISYIAGRIDNQKVTPKILGIHTTPLFGSSDSTSFPESLRLLQYIVNAGLTTKSGIFNIVNVEHWMKAFRHLINFIPFPTVYYTLQYADEKTVRWAGQMISYREDEFMNRIRPILLVSLLKAMRMEHIPRYMYTGLCYMTQELYSAVPEDEWYDVFKTSVLDRFVNEIPLENVCSSDVIFKNLRAALPCIRALERREDVFMSLSSVMKRNPILISRLICGSLWVDNELSAPEKIKQSLWDIINNISISKSYNVFCSFAISGTLTPEMQSAIDKKIVNENLKFAQSDYPAIINLSNLVVSDDGVNKIKQLVKSGDIWNCGITDAHYTDPMPYHIEMLNEKIRWTDEDWNQIWPNMEKNLTLIEQNKEVGVSSNFYNCMYIDLLSDMKLFLIRLQQESGINTDEVLARIETDIKQQSGFGNLMEALSSDDYNKISVALDLLNVCLKADSFEKHLPEIQLIIMKVVLMQSANIDKCISFIVCLMHDYREKMISHFGNLLLLMLKNYCDYDFEKFNFNVPLVHHWFSLIASQMTLEFETDSAVRYWTSEAVVKRFGNVDFDAINITNE